MCYLVENYQEKKEVGQHTQVSNRSSPTNFSSALGQSWKNVFDDVLIENAKFFLISSFFPNHMYSIYRYLFAFILHVLYNYQEP